jgi:hypothetical protein
MNANGVGTGFHRRSRAAVECLVSEYKQSGQGRMEKGRLHWPTSEDGRAQLPREEFALLIGGIDLIATKKRKWYRREEVKEATQPMKKSS